MRHRLERHLVQDGRAGAPSSGERDVFVKPARVLDKHPELSWRDYLVMLLHVGAEIEHGLLIEYLYAAYSLGGDQVPTAYRSMVRGWRDSIITVAREEMGHLLTVQNLLCLLGGPPSFDREDYPWDSPFYPFPFRLEPLTLRSLAYYVFAEMEPDQPDAIPGEGPEGKRFDAHDRARIVKTVKEAVQHPHHVGEIYNAILEIIKRPELIPDACFDPGTYSLQASWDEWGQGYRWRTADDGQPIPTRGPNVIVAQMASRTEAIAGLTAIAGQGEAPHLRGPGERGPSHFDRFVEIYQALEKVKDWTPVRPVPVNPSTRGPAQGGSGTYIRSPSSRAWANLLNIRYRLLLGYLAHTYRLPRDKGLPGARAAMLQRVFAEMFNIKTISEILVRLPLDGPEAPERAGPPFEMPYTTTLPPDDVDCWRLYRDMLETSRGLCQSLLSEAASVVGAEYLYALRQLDLGAVTWLDRLISGTTQRRGARR